MINWVGEGVMALWLVLPVADEEREHRASSAISSMMMTMSAVKISTSRFFFMGKHLQWHFFPLYMVFFGGASRLKT
jgi:hypothetical protein